MTRATATPTANAVVKAQANGKIAAGWFPFAVQPGTEMYNVMDHGAVGDGVADDTEAIRALIELGTATQPVAIYVPTGTYLVTNLPLGKNVHIFGPRSAVLKLKQKVDNTGHPFYCRGLERETYYYRQRYTLNAVVPGNTITLSTPGEAANFPANTYIVIISDLYSTNGVGVDRQPVFAPLNKVLSSDPATGVLTLQSPIQDNIGAATVAKEGDFVPGHPLETGGPYGGERDDRWACESSIRGITIDASTTVVTSHGLNLNATYRCEFTDIHIIGASGGISLNAQCYSIWRNCVWTRMRAPTPNKIRAIEIKTGSYESVFSDLHMHYTEEGTGTVTFIEMGEYANRCELRNLRVLAPRISLDSVYAIGYSSTMGVHCVMDGIYVQCKAARVAISVRDQFNTAYPNVIGAVIRNVVFDCPAVARATRIVAGNASSTKNEYTIDGVKMLQPLANPPFWTTDNAALVVDTLERTNGVRIANVIADAPLNWAVSLPLSGYNAPGLDISDFTVRSLSIPIVDAALRAQPWQLGMRRISRTVKTGRAAEVRTPGSLQQITATGDTVVIDATFDLTDTGTWANGDAIEIDLDGSFGGSGGSKSVKLEVDGVVILTLTDTVPNRWAIGLTLGLWGSPATSSVSGVAWGKRGGVVDAHNRVQLAGITSLVIKVTANVAVGGDEVRFIRRNVIPRLVYAD